MDTSCRGCIILHKQHIDDKLYLRIVATLSTEDYQQEAQSIYGEDKLDYIAFYNCADMYDRIISDIDHKKFKGVKKVKTICKSVWQVEELVDTWFEDELQEWMRARLSMYIEDKDDSCNVFLNDDGWDNTLVTITMHESHISYTINRCETTRDGDIIINKDHILSLLVYYLHNNAHTNATTECPDLKVQPYFARGAVINKCELSNTEVLSLLTQLDVSIDDHRKCLLYKWSLGSADTSYVSCENDRFKSWYSFIPGMDIPYHGENDHARVDVAVRSYLIMEPPQSQSKTNNGCRNEVGAKSIYLNSVRNKLSVFDIDIMYLHEFKKLEEFTDLDDFTDSILGHINNTTIIEKTVNNLKLLVATLDKLNATACEVKTAPVSEASNLQKYCTKMYVDKYKNDKMETPASIVVDNVLCQLRKDLPETSINKNQISTDLVELGVKKMRKAKGYVYGIEDTSKNSDANYWKTLFTPCHPHFINSSNSQ